MLAGIELICAVNHQQDGAHRHQDLFRYLPEQIVQHGRQQVHNQHAAQSEGQQSFRADPSVDIQEVAGVVPPLHAVIHLLQVPGDVVFHAAAQGDGQNKFQPGLFPKFI